ncbi:peptidyl-prolyl cis-trans isomerase FKBP16-1, chloroplastic isoform X1 [Asparagus officinalis]|nr:peptidyl-prolyl cis-trans isomerase FKBP16-1, chloroplastic isoform X1 [Asparagus officinalis]
MEALAIRTLSPINSKSQSPSNFVEKREPKRSSLKDLLRDFSSKKFCGMSRRKLLLETVALGSSIMLISPAISMPLQEANDSETIRYQKLNTGVKIQDVIEGEGPEAQEGDLVEINYVCRRSNGYFVHSTVDQFSGESRPVILPLDGNEIIQGLKEVLVGMKVGGKRRALIPPNVGYINETLKPIPEEFGPRRSLLSHANEPLVFEVQLLKVL